MEDKLVLTDFIRIMLNLNKTVQDNVKYLSELDSVIGDGDHGVTIARGFKSALKKIDEDSPESISDLLKKVGFALINNMGGASGPIFGSIFTEMAKKVEGLEYVDLDILYNMFLSVLDNEPNLGGAKPGDKTMIDSLAPTVASLKKSLNSKLSIKEALKNASKSAEEGAVSTKDMIAKKGRSRYLKERSLGYQDAGATTFYLIVKSIYESV